MRETLKQAAGSLGLLPLIHYLKRNKKRFYTKFISVIGLYQFLDSLEAKAMAKSLDKKNKIFVKENPHFAIPPVDLAYDAYAHVDWHTYHQGGIHDANWICSLILRHHHSRSLNILDWGCGPARVLRNLPLILKKCQINLYGTDYNQKTIEWCQNAFPSMQFVLNGLLPPLKFESDYFDVIYGISVLTHLSMDSHHKWIKELHRILKPGGILILTTHGDRYRNHLSEKELEKYNHNQLVVRSDSLEGKRAFATFHPPKFLRQQLFNSFDVLEHISGTNNDDIQFPQDIWVIKKR